MARITAGIFTSHIGFESAVSKDCWTLTRSILADNSPYYESGARLTYTSNNNKWLISALALNGWQRIQRPAGNSLMSAAFSRASAACVASACRKRSAEA